MTDLVLDVEQLAFQGAPVKRRQCTKYDGRICHHARFKYNGTVAANVSRTIAAISASRGIVIHYRPLSKKAPRSQIVP